ncbi:MAG: diaminopimelate epimerase [Saprospiraceae bacterium]
MQFYKYQGTGNDFIMIDQRETQYLTRADVTRIEQLCNRRFGIGADGLILLQNRDGYDFEMIYFNSDGRESSMCGNGGRCIVAFAKQLGVIKDKAYFLAIDGEHEAIIRPDGWVELKMTDVKSVENGGDYYYLNTGSPHYITFVNNIEEVNVFEQGRAIRYNDRFKKEGTNVNFVQAQADGIVVATYERGVEDETLSCGTGVTAAAIAYYMKSGRNINSTVPIQVKGGKLEVRFEPDGQGFTNIWLCGPAELVFEGDIE